MRSRAMIIDIAVMMVANLRFLGFELAQNQPGESAPRGQILIVGRDSYAWFIVGPNFIIGIRSSEIWQ